MLYNRNQNDIPLYIEKVASHVIDLAYGIHSEFGPGLLEKSYEFCLYNDLNDLGYYVRSQVSLPISHHDHVLEGAYRIDLVVNDCLVVEIKAIESIQPIHKSQVLTYLRTGGYRLGLLINFNSLRLMEGLKRVIN